MKKIINDSANVIGEMFDGFLEINSRYYTKIPGVTAFYYNNRRKNKVSLVVGGGSGHEPLFSGFVGRGLGDAAANGNIFASPNPAVIYQTARAVDEGKGVLFLYGNYAGDILNFDFAENLCRADGINVAHVRIMDDCASAPPERKDDRRGVSGDVFVVKVAGAACDAGLDLADVVRITEKARDNICSIGLATSPGTIPGLDKPTFEIGDDEIEYGIGIHGEPGIKREKIRHADAMVDELYEKIKEDMALSPHDEVVVLINGMGSTTLLELNIVFRRVSQRLRQDGVKIFDADANSYCTCQEMGGFFISIMKLDEEIKKYYSQPCFSPFYAKEEIIYE